MGGVGDQIRARLVGDLAEEGIVDVAGVGGGPAHDRLGPVSPGQRADLLVIDEPGLRVHPVGDEVEPAAGEVGRRPVREMAAVGQAQRQDGVAGPEQGGVGRQHRGGTRVGLDVGVFGIEQRPGPVHGDPLGEVDDLAAAVVPGPGIALRVLVGERRAERGQHGGRGEVLGGDQLERRRLPLRFPEQDLGQLGVLPAQDIGLGDTGDRHDALRASTVTYVQCRPGLGGARGRYALARTPVRAVPTGGRSPAAFRRVWAPR